MGNRVAKCVSCLVSSRLVVLCCFVSFRFVQTGKTTATTIMIIMDHHGKSSSSTLLSKGFIFSNLSLHFFLVFVQMPREFFGIIIDSLKSEHSLIFIVTNGFRASHESGIQFTPTLAQGVKLHSQFYHRILWPLDQAHTYTKHSQHPQTYNILTPKRIKHTHQTCEALSLPPISC